MKTATFGSISSGTMRAEDLIPAFSDALIELDDDYTYGTLIAKSKAWITVANMPAMNDDPGEAFADAGQEILTELFDALNEAAPDYGYFGAFEGDGADYGFWRW